MSYWPGFKIKGKSILKSVMSSSMLFYVFKLLITALWQTFLIRFCYTAFYLIHRFFYFTYYKFPYIHDSYFFGNTLRLCPDFPFLSKRGTPLLDAMKFYTQQFPKSFFVEWIFAYPIVIATDYELIHNVLACRDNIDKGVSYTFLEESFEQGLLTSNGSKWRYRRKLIEPTVGLRMLSSFLPIMKRNTDILIEDLRDKTGTQINLNDEIDRVALKVILQTAIGLSDEYLAEYIDEHVSNTRKVTQYCVFRVRNPILWITPIRKIYELWSGVSKTNKKFREFAVRAIHQKMQARINSLSRKRGSRGSIKDQNSSKMMIPNQRKVFIDLLIDKYFESLKDNNPYRIDEKGLYEEVQLLVFAGFDTSSTTIKWTLYNLGLNPAIQEKLYQEVSTFKLDDDDDLDPDYLKNFVYLEQVIKEGLRIRPTVPIVVRELGKDIFYKGFRIPKGTDVLASMFSVHSNPDIYPNPEEFNPDRFSPENIDKIPSKAFIPFATGPRKCIGRNYAMMEMKVIIANVVKNFRIIAKTPMDQIKYDLDMVSAPKDPLMVTLLPRRSLSVTEP
ncbi:cytochrome P450 4c21-like [Brevipalpus obovatus]|uniref:cytochrome P450 4c21-like n=1 Tax=Brevipalpus obovatus TaxID=246614 RepID=UPI003D9E29E2